MLPPLCRPFFLSAARDALLLPPSIQCLAVVAVSLWPNESVQEACFFGGSRPC